MDYLHEGERYDDLQISGLRIIQNPNYFCFGMDAVLLSGFVVAKAGEQVIDMCTGSGIIPLLLYAKTRASHITGIEIQQQVADMARRSVASNAIENISIITGDIRDCTLLAKYKNIDVVTCNPPYMKSGLTNPSDTKAIARHEICCSLEDAISAACAMLKNGGRFYMVHRPTRMADIFEVMGAHHMEIKRMRLVHSYADKEATMVLLEATKGGGRQTIVEPPLIIFEKDGSYTREIRQKYGY